MGVKERKKKMVVKTELCAFSEYRVYPGHGLKFVKINSTPVQLAGSKEKGLLNNKKKPAKLVWTQGWRRLHKKGKTEEGSRRRTRKTTKVQRAIVGASLEEIKAKRNQKPEKRDAIKEAALKEIKARKKAAQAQKKAVSGPTGGRAAPKQGSNKNARGGSKR